MQQIPTTFTRYKLTEQELIQGLIFNHSQYAVIQNRIADLAEEKLRLIFTPNDINTYLQREAELAGQIAILQSLLTTSDESSNQVHYNTQEN